MVEGKPGPKGDRHLKAANSLTGEISVMPRTKNEDGEKKSQGTREGGRKRGVHRKGWPVTMKRKNGEWQEREHDKKNSRGRQWFRILSEKKGKRKKKREGEKARE